MSMISFKMLPAILLNFSTNPFFSFFNNYRKENGIYTNIEELY